MEPFTDGRLFRVFDSAARFISPQNTLASHGDHFVDSPERILGRFLLVSSHFDSTDMSYQDITDTYAQIAASLYTDGTFG